MQDLSKFESKVCFVDINAALYLSGYVFFVF
jgi:hypothetical protein